ncbi:MAG: F0F1 ATP synthase subunit gamma [Geobacteraceae bacterium]|nr:F0F1 ATP synthase subunit gamma [Geobacteraceae bacterium]
MLTEEELRKKIKSARDLYEIVRTMKSLAAVSMRHYQKAVESAAEYFRTVELGLQVVLRSGPPGLSPLTGEKNTDLLAVLFGSDRGLCGSFNGRMVSYALEVLHKSLDRYEKRTILCAGEQAAVLLEAEGQPVAELVPVPDSLQGIVSQVHYLVIKIEELQRSGTIGSVVLFHNRLMAKSTYEPVFLNLLPIDRSWLEELRGRKWQTNGQPTFSMDRIALFSSLVRQYLFVMLYRAFVESMAAENASRLSSMHAAEKNIEERLDGLVSRYRQQRQSSITAELLDIVSGFKALRGRV